MLTVVDPVGNTTTFSYDNLNRKTQETDPLGKSSTFAYDAAGHMTSTTDRLARVRDFTYDNLGRLTQEVWKTSGSPVNTLTYSFDANGNMLTAGNANGTYTFSYDNLNRVHLVNELFGINLTFTYDAGNNRTKVEDSFGGVTTSVYNAVNLLTSRQFGGSGQTPLRIDYTYTGLNEQATVTRYSDLAGTTMVARTGYTYDNLGRILNLQHKDGSGTNLDNFTYTYDAASQVLTETRNTSNVTTYSYDNTQQLTNDSQTNYSYDVNGNRTMTGYTTGTGNRLTSDGTWTYSYDDEGNLTKKTKGANAETWTYGYDHLNHLVWVEKRATDGGTLQMRADYKYDVFGSRIEKAVDADGSGPGTTLTTRFAMDGWKSPKDAQGNPYSLVGNENWDVFADLNGSNQLQVRYVRGDQVDQLEARISSGGAVAWYLTDRLGSIRDITNSTGTVVDHLDYDGFGNTATTPSGGDRYLWTGREYDTESGLLYNRARYYDSHVGRWCTADPLELRPDDMNLYRYARNAPLTVLDPSGCLPTPPRATYNILFYVTPKNRPAMGGAFGAFAWGVNWVLRERTSPNTTKPGAATGKGGWILQHILISFLIKDEGGNPILNPRALGTAQDRDYWEAWRVKPGFDKPETGGAFDPDTRKALIDNKVPAQALTGVAHDWFFYKGVGQKSSGTISWVGEAYYVDNIDQKALDLLGFTKGGAPMSFDLMSVNSSNLKRGIDTILKNKDYSVTGPIDHRLSAEWGTGGKTTVTASKGRTP